MTTTSWIDVYGKSLDLKVEVSEDLEPTPVTITASGQTMRLSAQDVEALTYELLRVALCEACGLHLASLREEGRDVCLACVAPDLEPVRD